MNETNQKQVPPLPPQRNTKQPAAGPPKKITKADWLALTISYLGATYVAQIIIFGGPAWFKGKDFIECALFAFGSAIVFAGLAMGTTFLLSRKVSIGISSLLGFAIICFLQSGHIYSQARNAGLEPSAASARKNVFFIVVTLFAWGLYWGIRLLAEKFGLKETRHGQTES